MAWTNSNWITQTTVADRETSLRLHIQEVSDAISSRMMSDGTSIDPTTLVTYHKSLTDELKSIQGGGSRMTRGRILKK